MKFCETCGNMLIVKTIEYSKSLFCKKCDKNFPLTEDVLISFYYDDNSKEIRIVDEEPEFPTTNMLCPKCDEMVEAFWWMQQTRGGDEAPTRFYHCKKCNWRWRDYS